MLYKESKKKIKKIKKNYDKLWLVKYKLKHKKSNKGFVFIRLGIRIK